MAPLLRRPTPWIVLLVLGACLAFAPGRIDNIDTRICFRSALGFLGDGSFALDDPTALERRGLWAAEGADGSWYPKFGPAVAVLLLPLAWLGELAAPLLRAEPRVAAEFLASLTSSFLTALGALAAFRIARDALGVPARAAAIGALAWVFGTFQFAYAGSSYLETPLGVALLCALWAASASARRPVLGPLACGACAAVAVAVKVAALVCVPFVLLPLLTRDRRESLRRVAVAGVPLAAGAAVLAAVNVARFGSVTSTGYAPFETLFRTPLLTGLSGYLFDPDLSLALFAPAFFVGAAGWAAFARRAPLLFWGACGVLVSGAVVHALHTGYHGGTVLGPRYLVPVIPLLTAGGVALVAERATTVASRATLAAALAVCVAAQVPSVLVSPNEYHTIRGTFRDRGLDLADARRRWQVDWTLLAWKLAGDDERYDLARLARRPERVPADPWYDVPANDRGLAPWWILASRQGRRGAWVAGTLLAAAAAASAALLARTCRAADQAQRAQRP